MVGLYRAVLQRNAMEGQTQSTPLVSIGMAVYNGEKYLDEAIRSILAQTYTNFELIISDNASTDRTAEISRKRWNGEGWLP
jgi:GT2 family glycosyltransferase